MISLQFNEGAILKVGDAFVFQMYFYTVYCTNFHMYFTTYKMMYSFASEERGVYILCSRKYKRKEVLCLLCQEQLFIYGAAFVLD